MAGKSEQDAPEILEEGDIWFAYRPKVREEGEEEEPAAEALGDVADLYLILKPDKGRGRRFATENPHLLDYAGAQVVLSGARSDPEKAYHIDLEPERETERSAAIFKRLHVARSRHPIEPLLKGEWR